MVLEDEAGEREEVLRSVEVDGSAAAPFSLFFLAISRGDASGGCKAGVPRNSPASSSSSSSSACTCLVIVSGEDGVEVETICGSLGVERALETRD